MEIGVRELKQRLSKYLDEVAAGSEIVVTDRGRPKARIVPIREEGSLRQGMNEGWIRPATRTGPVGSAQRHRSPRRSADVLDEDRA